MSRPSGYSDEIADTICSRIANGEGLRAICRDPDMPGRQTVLGWLDDASKAAFRTKYARAREAQGDYLDEEMQTVADTATPETAQVARLRVDTMKWRASKLAPKKYGDKLELENKHSASDPLLALLGQVAATKKQIHDDGND